MKFDARTMLVSALALIMAGVVISQSWRGNVSSFAVGSMIVSGIFLGAVYAMLASGLVVAYVSSGVFNFAQGAIGMFLAYIYWQMAVGWGWPNPVAFVVVVFVLAPAVGFAIEPLMRRLKDLPLVTQIVVTVGLMLGLIGIAGIIWPLKTPTLPPFLESQGGFSLPGLPEINITYHRLITVLAAIGVAVGLRILLYRTKIGVAMRGVVDDEDLAALNGAPPIWVSRSAWMLSTTLAALATILISSEIRLQPDLTSLLIINAMAAAFIGRLQSLPWTFAGGLILGLTISFVQNMLELSGRWGPAREAVPGILLFIVLLALPVARLEVAKTLKRRPVRVPTIRDTVIGMAVLWLLMWIATGFLGEPNMILASVAVSTSLLMLSLIPLIGWAGQISLANWAFAGVGVVIMWQTVGTTGEWWGLLLAALAAIPFGIAMALPAIRLQGLYLAMASLAFAMIMEKMFFWHPETLNPDGDQILFADLDLFGFTFEAKTRGLIMLMVTVFGLMAVGLVALRRGRYGRRIIALRDSEVASATIGLNIAVTKIAVFAFSAAMAGFAGGFIAINQRSVTPQNFQPINGLAFVLLVVAGGMHSVSGAIFGAFFTFFFAFLQAETDWTVFQTLTIVGPAMAAFGIVASPDGAVVRIGNELAHFLPWRTDAKEAKAREDAVRASEEIGGLGISRPFTSEELMRVDRTLALPKLALADYDSLPSSAQLGIIDEPGPLPEWEQTNAP